MPQEKPLIRFGVIADPQYADLPPNLAFDRHYAKSIGKLEAAVEIFNREELSFVVTLGDLIDRDWRSFDKVLPVFGRSRHEAVHLPGNHDFAVAPERLGEVHARLGMPAPWHDFSREGFRFIVIDGNEVSLFSTLDGDARHALARKRLRSLIAEQAPNAQEWNGGMSDEQFGWLAATLEKAKAAGETAIVLGHYPLYPENQHNLWDYPRVLELFERAGNVAAYLCGHNHTGNLGRAGNTWFVNFKGMVDTEAENAFAVVEIFSDRISITGYGREESRTLLR